MEMDGNWTDVDENGWRWVDVQETKRGFESGLVLEPPKLHCIFQDSYTSNFEI